jgi:ABC-type dipeptide/oligopeptide/nickel transport system permease subunit
MRVIFLAFVLLLLVLAPSVTPYDPMATGASAAQLPSGVHLLGTDALGRDLLSRVMDGGWRTAFSAAAATILTLMLGVALGILEAFAPTVLAFSARALNDALLSLPGWLIALVVIAGTGQGWVAIIVAVALAQTAMTAKFTTGLVRQVQHESYFEASVALGSSASGLLRRVIVPNALPALASFSVFLFTNSILYGAGLSFLGLSGDLGTPEWGILIAEGRLIARQNIWAVIAPGLALIGLVWSVRGTVDDALSPRGSVY